MHHFFIAIQTRSNAGIFIKLGIVGIVIVFGVSSFLSGCVRTSTYEQVVGQYKVTAKERDALKEKVKMYETETKNLGLELDQTAYQLGAREKVLQETATELARKNEVLMAQGLELEAVSEQLQSKQQALSQSKEQLKLAAERTQQNQKLYDDLVGNLNSELEANQIKIKQMKDGIVVNLSESILFSSGSARLNKSGRSILTKVSDKLKNVKYQTIVAGFTDNIPIKGVLTKKFPTNWELAAARASSVVRLLEKNGLSGDRLAAVSYGENRPVDSNDTPAGRAQNRRIEIRLRPSE